MLTARYAHLPHIRLHFMHAGKSQKQRLAALGSIKSEDGCCPCMPALPCIWLQLLLPHAGKAVEQRLSRPASLW